MVLLLTEVPMQGLHDLDEEDEEQVDEPSHHPSCCTLAQQLVAVIVYMIVLNKHQLSYGFPSVHIYYCRGHRPGIKPVDATLRLNLNSQED